MSDGIGTDFPGNLNEASGDQRPCQRCGQRITPFVESIGPDGRKREFLDERLDQITDEGLTGAGIESLEADRLQFIALSEISGKGDHLLDTPFPLQIWNADTGIDTA